jgi:hypothetical protein
LESLEISSKVLFEQPTTLEESADNDLSDTDIKPEVKILALMRSKSLDKPSDSNDSNDSDKNPRHQISL